MRIVTRQKAGEVLVNFSLTTHQTSAHRCWHHASAAKSADSSWTAYLQGRYFDQDRESVAMFRWICDVVEEQKLQFYLHLKYAIIDVHFMPDSADSVYFEVVYTLAPNAMPRSGRAIA